MKCSVSNSTIMRFTLSTALCFSIGCASDNPEGAEATWKRSVGPSIGQIVHDLPQVDLVAKPAPKPSRDQVLAAYNEVYGKLPETNDNIAIGKRVADLQMLVGEDRDIAGESDPYKPAIEMYESLLSHGNPDNDVDQIIYQLARAHDLAGHADQALRYLKRLINEHPDSQYVPEARFRRGEIYFSDAQFEKAARDYAHVVKLADATAYYRNSAYMLGWSYFKQSEFESGLVHFFDVIDDLLPTENASAQELNSINNELLNDTFRVVTLALSYMDGPISLADQMRQRDKPHWQYLAYEQLARDYFDKRRFLDSVQTWQTFIEHNPLDVRAPGAHIGMIDTLSDAGFPSDILPKKREFVLRYGVYSPFWQHHAEQLRADYLPELHQYLLELAQLSHADAQQLAKQKNRDRDADAEFLSAAQWYEQLVATFPQHPDVAEYLFLQGETYTEADEHGLAVAAYQRVVREYPGFAAAHEAGYAAILGFSQLIDSATPQEHELWQRLKIDAQIEFALIFPGDDRAPSVQADAANELFELGQTSEALDLAENLLIEWPDVEPSLRSAALFIIGHVRFEQAQYAQAESAYKELSQLAGTPELRVEANQRWLAAVYKQGEVAESQSNVDDAVTHYLRIAQIDADAALAPQGHFDAVAVLEQAQRLPEAAQLLAEFRAKYPEHPLRDGVELRLAKLYEQSEDWQAAAAEFVQVSQMDTDPQVRQQSLYRAAQIYHENNQPDAAIEHFRSYANTYTQPWDLRLEAMHNLDGLYLSNGDTEKRRHWLKQKIALHKELGSDVNERALNLAASAQAELAAEQRQRFAQIALVQPLRKSLKKKQKALQSTVKAYEALAQYGVAEFVTSSTLEIAKLYEGLSSSIIASDRPAKLSELELAQYEILLEEQAYPFEEQAIDLHEINVRRAWDGTFDESVQGSFTALAKLMPGRYAKTEYEVSYARNVR